MTTATADALRAIIADVLGLDAERAAALEERSGLFGTLPELDSLGVATLLGEIEARMDVRFDDDAIDLDLLESFGGLVRGVDALRGTP